MGTSVAVTAPQHFLPCEVGIEARINLRECVEQDGAVLVAHALERVHAPRPSSTLVVDIDRFRPQWLRASCFVLMTHMIAEKLPRSMWTAFLQPVWLGQRRAPAAADAHILWLLLPSRAGGLAEAFFHALHEDKGRPPEKPPARAKARCPSIVAAEDWDEVVSEAGARNLISLRRGGGSGGPSAPAGFLEPDDFDRGDGDGDGEGGAVAASFEQLIRRPLNEFLEKFSWEAVAETWDAFCPDTGKLRHASFVRRLRLTDMHPEMLFRTVRLDLQARYLHSAALFGPRRAESDVMNLSTVAPALAPPRIVRPGRQYELVQPVMVPIAEHSTALWIDVKSRWGELTPRWMDAFVRSITVWFESHVEDGSFARLSEADLLNMQTRLQSDMGDLSARTTFRQNLSGVSECLLEMGSKISNGRGHVHDDVVGVLHILCAGGDAHRRIREDSPCTDHITFTVKVVTRRGATGKSHSAKSALLCNAAGTYESRGTTAAMQCPDVNNGETVFHDETEYAVSHAQVTEAAATNARTRKEFQSRNASVLRTASIDERGKRRQSVLDKRYVRFVEIYLGNHEQSIKDGSDFRRQDRWVIDGSSTRQDLIVQLRFDAMERDIAEYSDTLRDMQRVNQLLMSFVQAAEAWWSSAPAEFGMNDRVATKVLRCFLPVVGERLASEHSPELMFKTIAFAHTLRIIGAFYSQFFRRGGIFENETFEWSVHWPVLLRMLVVQIGDVALALGLTAGQFAPLTVDVVRTSVRAMCDDANAIPISASSGPARWWPKNISGGVVANRGCYLRVLFDLKVQSWTRDDFSNTTLGTQRICEGLGKIMEVAARQDSKLPSFSADQFATTILEMTRKDITSAAYVPRERLAPDIVPKDCTGLPLAISVCKICKRIVILPLHMVVIASMDEWMRVECPHARKIPREVRGADGQMRTEMRPEFESHSLDTHLVFSASAILTGRVEGFMPLPPPHVEWDVRTRCSKCNRTEKVHFRGTTYASALFHERRFMPSRCTCVADAAAAAAAAEATPPPPVVVVVAELTPPIDKEHEDDAELTPPIDNKEHEGDAEPEAISSVGGALAWDFDPPFEQANFITHCQSTLAERDPVGGHAFTVAWSTLKNSEDFLHTFRVRCPVHRSVQAVDRCGFWNVAMPHYTGGEVVEVYNDKLRKEWGMLSGAKSLLVDKSTGSVAPMFSLESFLIALTPHVEGSIGRQLLKRPALVVKYMPPRGTFHETQVDLRIHRSISEPNDTLVRDAFRDTIFKMHQRMDKSAAVIYPGPDGVCDIENHRFNPRVLKFRPQLNSAVKPRIDATAVIQRALDFGASEESVDPGRAFSHASDKSAAVARSLDRPEAPNESVFGQSARGMREVFTDPSVCVISEGIDAVCGLNETDWRIMKAYSFPSANGDNKRDNAWNDPEIRALLAEHAPAHAHTAALSGSTKSDRWRQLFLLLWGFDPVYHAACKWRLRRAGRAAEMTNWAPHRIKRKGIVTPRSVPLDPASKRVRRNPREELPATAEQAQEQKE